MPELTQRLIMSGNDRDGSLEAQPGTGTAEGLVWLGLHQRGSITRTIMVKPEGLAALLHGIAPGLSVTYEPPIEVPPNMGAVVRNGVGGYYIRVAKNPLGWTEPNAARRYDDEHIRGVLGNGGAVLSEGVDL